MPLIVDGYDTKGCATCGRPFASVPVGHSRTRGHTRPRKLHVVKGGAQGPKELRHDPCQTHCGQRLYVWQCQNCNHRQGNQTFRQWERNLRVGFDRRRHDVGGWLGVADRLVVLMDALRALGFVDNDF